MYFFKQKKFFLFSLLVHCFFIVPCRAIPQDARDKGFVDLREVDPTILIALRYFTKENFIGDVVDGYKKAVAIMTKQAALALKGVQAEVQKDGYSLVLYDAYRPQRAVDLFVRWGSDLQDQLKKLWYYPRINKEDVFDLDYISKRSGHSRGSTVDVTLIKRGDSIHAVVPKGRSLTDGFRSTYLDDGTVDMGSSFDLFDQASHTDSTLVAPEHQKLRNYLKTVMEKHGFKNLYCEWWHYTLNNEPFPREQDSSYFNFVID